MNKLVLMLEELDIYQERNVVLASDINFFTDTKLEAMGRSPALKKKSVATLTEIKEGFKFATFREYKILVYKDIYLGKIIFRV